MNRSLQSVSLAIVLAAAALAVAIPPAARAAPPAARAYAPENLRTLPYNDRVRVISLEYSEQSGGRRIPDDQLRFYLDQVDRSSWGFSRIKQDIAQSLAGNVGPQPPSGGTIRCESKGNDSQHCATPWRGPSRLVRQFSKNACVEGRSWSSGTDRVTVWNGCRGEFAPAAQVLPPIGSGGIRCESDYNRPRVCRTPWTGPSRLVRQTSGAPCIEGRTWLSRQGDVRVSSGCGGEFASAAQVLPPVGGGTIRCDSNDNKAHRCNTPWRGPSRLVRQISDNACVEGRSWSSGVGQLTVWSGCRGEFAPATQVLPGYPGNAGGYSVTCASTSNRVQSCTWNGAYGRPYLQRQLSSSACR